LHIVAIETSNRFCSAALYNGEDIIYKAELTPSCQASRIASLYEEVLQGQRIDYIAVAAGPGSFTGVRIGLAFARGLRLALSKPIIAMSNLEAIAYYIYGQEKEVKDIIVLQDAFRQEIYMQEFTIKAGPGELKLCKIPETKETLPPGFIIAGSAANLVSSDIYPIDSRYYWADAYMLALAAEYKLKNNLPSQEAEPIYLRPAL